MTGQALPPWAAAIRARRQELGWSQVQAVHALRRASDEELPGVAEMLRSWKRWESGRHRPTRYRFLLAEVLRLPEILDLDANDQGDPDRVPTPTVPSTPVESDPFATGDLDDALWELQAALHPQAVNGALLTLIEQRAVEIDQSFGQWPQHRTWAETGRYLTAVSQWLANPQPAATRQRLVRLAGHLSGLRGCVLFDQMQHREALTWFETARSAAIEGGDAELEAWLLAYSSLIDSDDEDVTSAHQRLEQASSLATRSDSATLRLWVDLLWARALATIGDRRSFDVIIDQVHGGIPTTSSADRRHGMDFAEDRLDPSYYHASGCLALGQLEEARQAFRSAEERLPRDRHRARAVVGLCLASVSTAEGEIDHAATRVSDALRLIEGEVVGRVTKRAIEVRADLGPAGQSQSLRDLDQQLAT